MTQHEQREALESLLTHPGWLILADHIGQEWGPNGLAYNAALDTALNLLDDNAAASQARQIRAGRRVIENLVSWPSEEIARLKRADKPLEQTQSRRGGL